MNYLAFGVPPDDCFEAAHDFEHRPGRLRETGIPSCNEPAGSILPSGCIAAAGIP